MDDSPETVATEHDQELPSGFVYFAHDEHAKAIKIGWSQNPLQRLASIQALNPRGVKLLAFVPGDYHMEQRFHWRWRELRIHGEWFSATPELVAAINALGSSLRVEEPQAQRTATIAEMESAYVAEVMEICQGNKTRAARILGIDRRSLYRRLARSAVK